MKKTFKRLGAILLALVLCISMSAVAFAAEADINLETSAETAQVYSIGQVLYTKSEQLNNSSTTFTITTSEANWDADFILSVAGSSGEKFTVTLLAANGTFYDSTVYANGTGATFNMSYAKSGTYTFTFTRSNGSTTPVVCTAQICD